MATEDREEFLLTGETRPLQCVCTSIRPPAPTRMHLSVGRAPGQNSSFVSLFIHVDYPSVLFILQFIFPAGKKTLLQLLLLANFYWLNEEGK